MKLQISMLLIFTVSSCTTLNDQSKLKDRLQSRQSDFKSLESAYLQLPCTNYGLGNDSAVLEYGPQDKVIEIKNSRSYIKKICFNGVTSKIIVTGRHVGGGQGNAFYAVPAFVGFASKKQISATYKMRETVMSGHLEFTMTSTTKFDSMLVFLDTIDLDKPFGGKSLTMFINPVISMPLPVSYYKYPEGKIEISSKD